MPRIQRLARLLMLAAACSPAVAVAAAVKVQVDGFGCRSGKYPFTIASHYPSLFRIGQHKVFDVAAQTQGSETVTLRRIEYIGMTLEVRVSSLKPLHHDLVRAEVWSRRWNVGRLSVGRRPWQSDPEPALAKTRLDGELELVGLHDAALLRLADGRVERVVFTCAGPR